MALLMTTYIAKFAVIAFASKQIGQLFTRAKLPLISGYLFTGVMVGPFALGLVPADSIESLRFIDEVSLAVIAFAAGSELHLEELRSGLRSITWVTAGLITATFTLGSLTFFLLSNLIPFTRTMPASGRIAVSVLIGAILVARSPASAIAIINELRAKGPFTKTALGVTIVMDVVVIVLFAINSSLADALLTNLGFDLSFFLLLIAELLLSALIGYVTAKVLHFILSRHTDRRLKIGLALLTGYAVFALSIAIRTGSRERLSFEVLLEPLLICMVAGFFVTNYSDYRDEFLAILQEVGPPVYVVFFTLTGASLALDILVQTWPIALGLFVVRLIGIFIGSFSGGMIAGDPMHYNRVAWMAYVTQAGVGLGLAKEVAVEFPEWGGAFATIIISVIVLNQIVGPPLFKLVIKRVGEAHLPGLANPDEIRDAVILGVEAQSLALARQLKAHNWEVIMADTDASHIEQIAAEDVEERWVEEIDQETLSGLITNATDALVAMLHDDAANLKACELAYEFGIPRVIARLNNPAWMDKFLELGVLVVDPASAMVNLLDQFVRSPQAAALLLHQEPGYDTAQITITDPDLAGLPLRDLRLPTDVLILGITRGNQLVVPHGYTALHLYDEVTLVGKPESLEEATLRLGF